MGGVGKIVDIDEAKIGDQKYSRGRLIEGKWLFDGIEPNLGRIFIVSVATRGYETLLPIIKEYILPGSTIISDCWCTYQCLEFEGFQHYTVNHTYNFIDSNTGAHTQNIERL